ncbi:MAG: M28 family peptidase [Planctomycetota bacterium]
MTRSPALGLAPALLVLAGACRSGPQDPGRGEPRPPVATRPSAEAVAFRKATPAEKDLGDRALAWVRKVVALGPRVPGSEARAKAADLVVAELRRLGLEPVREPFTADGERLRFENVRCPIPGRSARVLILATHYDTKRSITRGEDDDGAPFLGANDGGSGVGLLLALAADLARLDEAARPSLELVFFDGEESLDTAWNRAERALFGSREFARKHLVDGHRYGGMVLLDMVGHRRLSIDLDEASTAAMAAPVRAAAAALGYEDHFFRHKTRVEDDHVPLLAKGLPCLDLIQFEDNPEWHTPKDDLAVLAPRSLAIVGRVLWRALPDLEAGYGGEGGR